jgi:hypothetical protein
MFLHSILYLSVIGGFPRPAQRCAGWQFSLGSDVLAVVKARVECFPKNQSFGFGTRLADHALDVL